MNQRVKIGNRCPPFTLMLGTSNQSREEQHMKPEKHGAAAGEAGKPDSVDWTIDQGWENYTAEEHRVWKTLFERQSKLLPGRACDEFIQGMRNLTMDTEQIPDFRRLSEVLMKRTGWQVVAV